MFGHPSGDALADSQLQSIDDIRVRRLRCAQHEVVVVEHVHETRVALHDGRHEVDDAREDGVQGISSRDPAADFMEKIDVRLRVHVNFVVGDLHRRDTTHVLSTIHMRWAMNKGVRGYVCVESTETADNIE